MEEQYLNAWTVSEIVGCHYRSIENWAKKGHIKKNDRGYPLIASLQYQLNYYKKKVEKKEVEPKGSELYQAEVRLKTAQADIKELERDEKKGLLVEIDSVTRQWQELIFKCRSKLLSLPNKLALELSATSNPAEIQDRLQQVIDEALNELSNG